MWEWNPGQTPQCTIQLRPPWLPSISEVSPRQQLETFSLCCKCFCMSVFDRAERRWTQAGMSNHCPKHCTFFSFVCLFFFLVFKLISNGAEHPTFYLKSKAPAMPKSRQMPDVIHTPPLDPTPWFKIPFAVVQLTWQRRMMAAFYWWLYCALCCLYDYMTLSSRFSKHTFLRFSQTTGFLGI